MDIEIIAPRKSADGILFYVNANGTKTGISISGLERLMGMAARGKLFTDSPLLLRMVEGGHGESIPKALEPAWGNVFEVTAKGADNARIVKSDAVACIIEYYAFERKNPVAMESFRKFAKRGVPDWIKEVTNFSVQNDDSELLQAVRELLPEVKRLTAKVEKWDRIEGITASVYPGMHSLNLGLSGEGNQLLLDNNILYTATDWLHLKGYVVDKSTKHAFCLQASDTYLTMTGKRPTEKYVMKHTRRGSRSVKAGKGYRCLDFHILEVAWNSLQSNKAA